MYISDEAVLQMERQRAELVNILRNKDVSIETDATMKEAIESVRQNLHNENRSRLLIEGIATEYRDNEITYVAQYGFYGKKRLTKVYAPNVVRLYSPAFSQCDSLKNVYLPNLTEMIGIFNSSGSQFDNTIIENLILPKFSYSQFPTNQYSLFFVAMSNLKRLIIPKYSRLLTERGNANQAELIDCISVSSISGNYLKLKILVLRSETDFGGLSNVAYISNIQEIYVPEVIIDRIKTATNWSIYADKFIALEGSKYEAEDWYLDEEWYKTEEEAVWQ